MAAVAHTTLVLLVLTAQCAMYPRGGQTISRAAWGVLGAATGVSLLGLLLVAAGAIDWLNYVSIFSYIKVR